MPSAVCASAATGGSGLTARCTSCLRQLTQTTPWPLGTTRLGSSSSSPLPLFARAAASATANLDSSILICVSKASLSSANADSVSRKRFSQAAISARWRARSASSALRLASISSSEPPICSLRNSSSALIFVFSSASLSLSLTSSSRSSSKASAFSVMASSSLFVRASSDWQNSREFSSELTGCIATRALKTWSLKEGQASAPRERRRSRCPASFKRATKRSRVALRLTTCSRSTSSCWPSSRTSLCLLTSRSSNFRWSFSFTARVRHMRSTMPLYSSFSFASSRCSSSRSMKFRLRTKAACLAWRSRSSRRVLM
mmetsp:Transcript_70054/g.176502  ORF Transcript_70054/g.176502 Transcript_70054/m.176502 type:complete len:315 (-) Transcript_70054:625-1569(-)